MSTTLLSNYGPGWYIDYIDGKLQSMENQNPKQEYQWLQNYLCNCDRQRELFLKEVNNRETIAAIEAKSKALHLCLGKAAT